jgi:molybdate transport system substrate-binding protein
LVTRALEAPERLHPGLVAAIFAGETPSMRKKVFAGIAALTLGFFGALHASAQTPVPAAPVDPNQPIPAQPVPAQPVAPPPTATAPAPATNASAASGPQLSILADSSLRAVIQELAQTWADDQPTSPQVPITLTNAGTIRTQLNSNPVWDVVISPDAADMKALTEQGLLFADGQRSLARNTVVIYGRKALLKDDALDWFDLVGTEWKKIAFGNPDLCTSGRIANRALKNHDLLDEEHKSIYVYAGTEALALQIVERDQADAVFVYRTDLGSAAVPGFEVVPLNAVDAPPVFYLAAVGRLAKNPDAARSFIAYCGSEAARPIWTKYGFEMN